MIFKAIPTYFLRYSYGMKMKGIMLLGSFLALFLAFYQYNTNTALLTKYADEATVRLETAVDNQLSHIRELIREIAHDSSKNAFGKQKFDSEWSAFIDNLDAAYNHNSTLQTLPAWSELKITLQKIREIFQAATFTETEEALVLGDTALLKKQLSDIVYTLRAIQSRTLLHQIYVTCILSSLGVLIAILFYTTRVIRRPIALLKDAAESFAKGDLRTRVANTTEDEVGEICRTFNETAGFVEETMKSIKQISDTLVKLATKVRNTANELKLTLMGQEQEVNLILHHAKEIAMTVHNFSNTLQLLNRSISHTSIAASIGQTGLTEMEAIMKLMTEASSNIVNTLAGLKNKVANINTIISTIIEIDDQINLLSLNTAIRANQAGEEGRGFSIIALKIKEIAGQSALATLDIEKIVKEIVESVSLTSDEIDKFSRLIENQGEDSVQVSTKLKILIQETQDKILLFEQINEEMADQSRRASDIHSAILSLSLAAKGSTLSIQKLHNEIEFLHQSSTHLENKIMFFTVSDNLK